jgi:hypothetical protein
MGHAALRTKLHDYIDATDDARIEALYTLLRSDMQSGYEYSDEELNMLHERAEKYLGGATKTYTVEESLNLIRQQKKNNEL